MRNFKLAAATLALGLGLLPQAANAWANKDYAYRKAITVDAKAAGLSEGLKHYPVLVRLDSGQFSFKDVQASGADIRFYDGDDKTPLDYQIESFDPQLGLAMVWVDVPELPAGGQHPIWMYYSSAKAKDGQTASRVFDAQFHGVWHFAGANPALDSTAYGATASSVSPAAAAAIGQGAEFLGQQGVTLPQPAVNPADGFTFEVWAHEKSAQPKAVVYSRGGEGAGGLTIGLDNGVPTLDVAGQHAAAQAAVGTDWVHLAVVGDATRTVLYVNGQPAATAKAPIPALSGPATLGGPAPLGGVGFQGEMDEARVSAVARSQAFIAADVASQKQGGTLVALGADEKPSGAGFGYFGVIFRNITPDAWVVIGVLALMAALSWVVMWAKGSYIGAVASANRAFDRRFRELGRDDLLALDKADGAGLSQSSLFRIYRVGVSELHARGDLRGRALTEETVEAIRASLDAQQVEENQQLDRWMVLLTIAISGGPFIGLLGTVLGVMITFAAIAAAGDVNVNAIAPGIAAALLATVAGLFVAIPALFGYNYLSSRNADISAKMQVFADQFITRLAEVQRNASLGSQEGLGARAHAAPAE
jgi:biopolymer transport protein ExbB